MLNLLSRQASAGEPESEPKADDAPTLHVRGLRVEFPTLSDAPAVVLRSVDLQIRWGEIFGLVGESGAGKTTLARALLRLPPAPGRIAGGEIHMRGEDLMTLGEADLQKKRGRDMSMIVPNPRGELNPLITVGVQIATVIGVHLGLDKRRSRQAALEMLRAVQIPDPERRLDAYPHELSGGMAQRVVIAIALACSPSFIVSDDATSGLDVTVQAQILRLLRRLAADRGSSMLFITRDIGITAHFCDRIAVMFEGEIMEQAPREAFFLAPRNPYTVVLMAAFSHNARLRQLWAPRDAAPPLGAASGSEDACPFRHRCPLVQSRCHHERPALRTVAPDHLVRCHFPVAR